MEGVDGKAKRLFLAGLFLSTATTKNNAGALLEQADQFSELYNWIAATPLYREAGNLFTRQ